MEARDALRSMQAAIEWLRAARERMYPLADSALGKDGMSVLLLLMEGREGGRGLVWCDASKSYRGGLVCVTDNGSSCDFVGIC